MTEIETVELPIVKPEIKIHKAIRYKLLNQIRVESQVIVHCSFTGTSVYDRIRIWKSTFLYPKESKRKSKLVHHENITPPPCLCRKACAVSRQDTGEFIAQPFKLIVTFRAGLLHSALLEIYRTYSIHKMQHWNVHTKQNCPASVSSS